MAMRSRSSSFSTAVVCMADPENACRSSFTARVRGQYIYGALESNQINTAALEAKFRSLLGG